MEWMAPWILTTSNCLQIEGRKQIPHSVINRILFCYHYNHQGRLFTLRSSLDCKAKNPLIRFSNEQQAALMATGFFFSGACKLWNPFENEKAVQSFCRFSSHFFNSFNSDFSNGYTKQSECIKSMFHLNNPPSGVILMSCLRLRSS